MFKKEIINDAVVIIIPYRRNKTWSQDFLLLSDVHVDNKACKVGLLHKHCKEAIERNAGIIDNGDFFDCMGGKYDKRSNKADILPRFQVPNYFDEVTNFGVEVLEPYKDNIILMGAGNHELSITAHHEINLTTNLIDKLGGDIIYQKYTGWIVYKFVEEDAANQPTRTSVTMYRTHGNGGNSPVTKGMIQSARRQDMIEADLYISGHIHTNYEVGRPKWYLDQNHNVRIKNPIHKQLGTYKDSTGKTFEDMKGFCPPSLGGTWLTFKYDTDSKRIKFKFQDCE